MTTPSTLGWIVPGPEMERAPRVREDALCDCPWCGQGARACGYCMANKKEARTADPRLLPHLQPRDAQLDTTCRYADSRQTDLFPRGNGSYRSATGGFTGLCSTGPTFPRELLRLW